LFRWIPLKSNRSRPGWYCQKKRISFHFIPASEFFALIWRLTELLVKLTQRTCFKCSFCLCRKWFWLVCDFGESW
jgi:hypothetical protein